MDSTHDSSERKVTITSDIFLDILSNRYGAPLRLEWHESDGGLPDGDRALKKVYRCGTSTTGAEYKELVLHFNWGWDDHRDKETEIQIENLEECIGIKAQLDVSEAKFRLQDVFCLDSDIDSQGIPTSGKVTLVYFESVA